LARLSPTHQAVLLLQKRDGMSREEVARALGCLSTQSRSMSFRRWRSSEPRGLTRKAALTYKTRSGEELRIAEEAAEWLAELDAANPEQRARFARWITESPLHLREFLLMTSLESELHGLDPKIGLSREAILRAVPNNVIPLSLNVNSAVPESAVGGPDKRRRWALPAIAATVLVSVVVPLLLTPKSQQFETAVGSSERSHSSMAQSFI